MKRGHLCLVAFLGISCAGAGWLGARIATAHRKPSLQVVDGLAVSLEALDLGEVREQKDFLCDLSIANQNAFPAEIVDFSVSCACVGVEPRALTIPPGQTASVQVKLDLTKRGADEVGRATRPLSVELKPILKGPRSKQPGWQIGGIVNSSVTMNALFLQFGDTPVRGAPPSRARYWSPPTYRTVESRQQSAQK